MPRHIYLKETRPDSRFPWGWATAVAGFVLIANLTNDKPHAIKLKASSNGHFYVAGRANGVPLQFLVDTGATVTTLPRAMATGLGLGPFVFNHTAATANGSVRDAAVNIPELIISGVTFRNVSAAVTTGDLDEPLLGASFLNKLHSYHVEAGEMTLNY